MDKCHLCIPIIGPTQPQIIQQITYAIKIGDWIELRLDLWDTIDPHFIIQLRAQFPQISMIFTLRRVSHRSEEERMALVASLMHLKPEFIDIEADVLPAIIQELKKISPVTKWIVSWHDVESTPKDLNALFKWVSRIPADFYKIATQANSICDTLRMMQLAKEINQHSSVLCAICMGELGKASRILSPVFNQPFTFAALQNGLESAAGQISAQELLENYHFRRLNRHTQIFGLIGDPVSQSVSHVTHNAVFDSLDINAVYIKFKVLPQELDLFFAIIQSLPFRGLSVTMPYKEAVLKYIQNELSEKSCNTLLYENGAFIGCNTDGKGALKALGVNIEGKKIAILGTGGSAKAIVHAAKKRGAHLYIYSRNLAKAQALGAPGTLDDIPKCDILIQTTPVGMLSSETPINSHLIHPKTLVMDIITNPRETQLVKECQQKGCTVVNGMEMFIQQAVGQFDFWFEEKYQVESILRESLKPKLRGRLTLPSSKSHSIRAVLLGAMAQGTSRIFNVLDSPDIHCAIQAARQLGASIDQNKDGLIIQGMGGYPQAPDDVIQVGNSGQVLRFVGALAALSPHYTVLTGDLSIRSNRPVQPLLDGLRELGAFAESSRGNGKAPVVVKGPMQPGETFLNGEDSQPVSGLLMAAAFMEGKTTIHVKNPGETPWIDLTLSWLDRLGVCYQNENYTRYIVDGKREHQAFEYTVPGDFSSAAFPIVAALITGSEIVIDNVDMNDVQGDKAIIPILQAMGAQIEIDGAHRCLTIKKSPQLKGMTIDLNPVIDAVTILAVLGCFAEGETHLINGEIARQKECDRLACIAQELSKMGATIRETDDGLVIQKSKLHGTSVQSHHDHRMAMSLLVASLGADGETHVADLDCIQKSYPTFIKDMQAIGAPFK